ncbi:MAG: hypothetical protein INR66_13015 [Gordonia polyisoprenivorans]|nr:hypothetical protein [Gordonia polyisoprenivorans]
MNTVIVPATLDDAVNSLAGIGKLLTAKRWERAAIVYAFTHDGTNQHDQVHDYSCSIREFARLGIAGLTTQDSVRRYRKAWAGAIAAEWVREATPGGVVALPDVEWGTPTDRQCRSDHLAIMDYEEAVERTAQIRGYLDHMGELLDQLAEVDPDQAEHMRGWCEGFLQAKFETLTS